MANTVIDYARPAKVQFYELLNAMATEVLAEEDITLSAPADHTGDTNTKISVTINRLVVPNPKELFYNRVDVASVFSNQAVISVRELDMGVVGDKPDIDGTFVDTLYAKYGFKVHGADFDTVKVDDYNVTITAKDGNLGYIGNFAVNIEKSLATRIPNTILGGFNPSQLVLS